MQITIEIADKLVNEVARTYSYDPASGITLQEHLEKRFSDQIYSEVRANVENVERAKFAVQSADAIITKSDITAPSRK